MILLFCFSFFFFNATAPTEIYTLSLHDALPISRPWMYPRRSGSPSPSLPSSRDRKSTRLNSSHVSISYAVFCLKKKNTDRLIYFNLKIHSCSIVLQYVSIHH